VADVDQPILGADFLAKHNILVDLKEARLVDKQTTAKTRGSCRQEAAPNVKVIETENEYFLLMKDFPP